MKAESLKQVCTGCGACAGICPTGSIKMQKDENGFLYPQIHEEVCNGCGLCERVCPVQNLSEKVNTKPIAYAAYTNDSSLRAESSSGGLFGTIAKKVLDLGGIVIGAAFTEDCRTVYHTAAGSQEELSRLYGSKYVQSEIGPAFTTAKEYLDEGCPVFFAGTPCQISGLKAYLRRDYEKLLCADLACHGVTSSKVWGKYVDAREKEANALVRQVCFRDKSAGWRGYSVRLGFSDGSQYKKEQGNDTYMRIYLSDNCLRPSCYDCRFKGLNRVSDLTIADFWGIEHVLPEMDDNKGVSLVLAHSQKGVDMLKLISGSINMKQADVAAATAGNPALIKSAGQKTGGNAFWSDLERMPFDDLSKKYAPNKTKVRRVLAAVLRKLKLLELFRKQ